MKNAAVSAPEMREVGRGPPVAVAPFRGRYEPIRRVFDTLEFQDTFCKGPFHGGIGEKAATEALFEFQRIGNSVKVTAVGPPERIHGPRSKS